MAVTLFSSAKRLKDRMVSAVMGIYVAVGFFLIMLFALYMTLLMSPEFLRRFLHSVMQCEDFPGYLSPNSTGADTSDYSEFRSFYSRSTEIPAPAPAVHPAAELNTSLAKTEMAQLQKPQKFSVLVGILTTAGAFDRRQRVRLAYAGQSSHDADFTVRFVLGALENDEDRIWVGMENASFGDILVLPCEENMNEGKTFTYFTTVAVMGVKYDYVMKTDDDSYVRISNLGKQLAPMPRTDLYYGYNLHCYKDRLGAPFFGGAGYMISWDLVLWINNSPIPRNRTIGTEDILVWDWFQEGGVAKNRPVPGGFQDLIEQGGECAQELSINDTVLVHQLKSPESWQKVLAFFEKDRLSKYLTIN
ncbi:unnamed protein product [Calypogeia fissa]